MHGPRCRLAVRPGRWEVRARIERFVEPAILLVIKNRPSHGYEIQELLCELVDDESCLDLGNLYRILRSLETDGVVTSAWQDGLSGPHRRKYEITDSGVLLLDSWVEALKKNCEIVSSFLHLYERSAVKGPQKGRQSNSGGQASTGLPGSVELGERLREQK